MALQEYCQTGLGSHRAKLQVNAFHNGCRIGLAL